MAGPTPAWNMVPAYKHCRFSDGSPCVGVATFKATALARDVPNKITVYPKLISVTLDSTGSYSVELPAVDDPDIAGVFAYQYDESWEGGEHFLFSLPLASAAPPGFDMGTATPLVPSDGFSGALTVEAFNQAVATELVRSEQVRNIVALTQAEYDSLGSPSNTTFYVIVG